MAAGVSATIFCGSASSLTAVPSSSVRLTGKAGTGVGLAVGAGVAVGAAVGADVGDATATLGDAPALLHAPPRTATSDSRTSRMRNDGRGDGDIGESLRTGRARSRSIAGPLASGMAKRGGLSGGVHGPAYLSLEGSSMHREVGDRTSAPWRAVTVAGLCRNRTGFATTRRGSLVSARSVAQAPPRPPRPRPTDKGADKRPLRRCPPRLPAASRPPGEVHPSWWDTGGFEPLHPGSSRSAPRRRSSPRPSPRGTVRGRRRRAPATRRSG